jgi:hypothetical protein
MRLIFESGTSSVLLNGTPGKVFHCTRGVRQGDPLSPLLFVLATDFLQTLLNSAKNNNNLTLPIPLHNDSGFPILQYANDTLIFMHGDVNQLLHLKALLLSFAKTSSLKVNFEKSFLVPINVSDERMQILASTFQCSIGSLPFTYLGLPLSISRQTMANFWPLLSKCERRLVAFSSFLSEVGRLELTKVVLTSFPTYAMCSFMLPKIVLKQIDKYRKHYLWCGYDLNNRKPPEAPWHMVCLPKEEGGLGVLDLNAQNRSMLMKQLHKFFNKAIVPWIQLIWDHHFVRGKLPFHGKAAKGSLWWCNLLKLLLSLKEVAHPLLKDGTTCLLWHDTWDGQVWTQTHPELFSFARNKFIYVSTAASTPLLQDLFFLSLSSEAFSQFQLLSKAL